MRKNDGKGTITDTEDGKDVKATKLMEFIEALHPKEAKIGVKIRFMHDLDGTVYWLYHTRQTHKIQESSEVEIRGKYLPNR